MKVGVLYVKIMLDFIIEGAQSIYNDSGLAAYKLSARAWQSLQAYPSSGDFPEIPLLVPSTSNSAISFSGGGSRAYIATLGYLSALYKLNALDRMRYIGGVSGSAWAVLSYIYSQKYNSDETLLGDIVYPENLSTDKISHMHPDCMRGFAERNFTAILLRHLLQPRDSHEPRAPATESKKVK